MSIVLHVQVSLGDRVIHEKTFSPGVIKLGRFERAHVRLDDRAIAMMHAVIEHNGDDVRLIDLGSATGSRVNGDRVEKHRRLADGDEISLGPYRINVRFERRRSPVAVDLRDVERDDGGSVAEVVVRYGGTILDVQHVGQVKPRDHTAIRWMAIGGLLFALGVGLLAYAIATVAGPGQDPSTAIAPDATIGMGGIGLLLGLLSVVPLTLGGIRRYDRGLETYSIGEGHGVTFATPTVGLPSPDGFALVTHRCHEICLRITSQMCGEVTLNGLTTALSEIVAAGVAKRQSDSTWTLVLPRDSRCRIEHAGLTFFINVVAPGKVIAQHSEVDRPFVLSNAATFASLAILLAMAHFTSRDPMSVDLDDTLTELRFVGFFSQPDVPPPEPPVDREIATAGSGGAPGARTRGAEGAAGNPRSTATAKRLALKGPTDAAPQLARDFDPERSARKASILGLMQDQSASFLASPFGGAFAQGNDDEEAWGNMVGQDIGDASGMSGMGLIGSGRGGGGNSEGTVGLSDIGLIGTRGDRGTLEGYGRGGSGTGFGTRHPRTPTVREHQITTRGALDRDIVRRVVRAHINEVRHCYNQGLVRDPNLRGRVAVQFTIGSTGAVPVSVVRESSLTDPKVGHCVAQAVKRWTFPKPQGGGNVVVTYPFLLAPG